MFSDSGSGQAAADEMAVAGIVGKELLVAATSDDAAVFQKTNLIDTDQGLRGVRDE